jgi:hypothetical protein
MLKVLQSGLMGVHRESLMKKREEQLVHYPLRLNWMQLGSLDVARHTPLLRE